MGSHALEMIDELEQRPSPVPPHLKASIAQTKDLVQKAKVAMDGSEHARVSCCDSRDQLFLRYLDDLQQWQDKWVFDIDDVKCALNAGKLGQRKARNLDYEGALATFNEALKKSPWDAFLHRERGRMRMHLHEDREARDDFYNAVRHNVRSGDPVARCFILLFEAEEHRDAGSSEARRHL